MILSENIPRTTAAFLRRCRIDAMKGRYAKPPAAYLEFLIAASRAADPRILEYLRVNDRESGAARYYGQADHIVPQSVWTILMPDDLIGPTTPDGYSALLSNLFWRDPHFNASCDQPIIGHIQAEAKNHSRHAAATRQWAEKWIQFFLDTKRDEGMLFAGVPVDPLTLDKRLLISENSSNWLVPETPS